MAQQMRASALSDDLDRLIAELEALREDIAGKAEARRELLSELPEDRQPSALNLLHYLALRSRDLRPLQDRLARLGMSSIGRAEPLVMATLSAVLNNLYLVSGRKQANGDLAGIRDEFDRLADRLEHNAARLLGPPPPQRRARIMVTMPADAARDYLMVHQLLGYGMDCMRINCAHDGPETWLQIIRHKRYAERANGRTCPVLMDLRGPKLRTGPMEAAPAVLKIRPKRDAYGAVLRPARIWLSADPGGGSEAAAADACLAVDPDWLARCGPDDHILLKDARDSNRRWRIREATPGGCWVESAKTTYIVNGTRLWLGRGNRDTQIGGLPARAGAVLLRRGDVLLLSAGDEPGRPAYLADDGTQLRPGCVSLPIPEVYRDARPGEPVCFDDGRISGLIEKRSEGQLQVRVTHTQRPVERLAADKGVNLPDTRLDLPALCAEDIQDLDFVARHADMVGLSFTNTPDDVRELRRRLAEREAEKIGVIVKIETSRGFANLPAILLEALKFPACGVMIARGDLAVECGFERLAELQEEIMWICESAHVPVIWATQVLEGLNKRGHATRAEITDAAMSQAAECVMLNKGPYVEQAVRTLDDILRRMQDHKSKKRSMLRRLELAAAFSTEAR